MRRRANDVVIRTEIGFEEDLMRRLIEGTLNIGLMYTPSHCPGLVVERLFGETLVLVSTRPSDTGPGEDYSYIKWGRVSMPSMCRAILTSSDRRRSPTSAGLASRSRSPTETAASCPPHGCLLYYRWSLAPRAGVLGVRSPCLHGLPSRKLQRYTGISGGRLAGVGDKGACSARVM
jgi:hypothetical protein